MYAPYFGLKGEPFSIAPDPRFLFMSERHREALAHLLYGLGSGGGFVLLTGEIGTGKTTVCRLFLEQIPAGCNVAYIFNPKLTVIELLQSICDEFHIAVPRGGDPTVKELLDPLNDFLLAEHAAGRNNVLIIDEAQNLSPDVLEQLRLLTNLETRERKLLQIVLIGQPELRVMLARPELEQLAQRVIARYHLGALTPSETARYVQHRLEVAGLSRPMPFERTALKRIHDLARGVPRRINLLCDRALLGAFANSLASVDRATVDKAAVEVFDAPSDHAQGARRRTAVVLATGLVAGAALFAAGAHVMQRTETPVISGAAAAPAAGGAVASRTLAGEQLVAARAQLVASRAQLVASRAQLVASRTQFAASRAQGGASTSGGAQSRVSAAPALMTRMDDAWRELAGQWKATPGAGQVTPGAAGDPCKSLQGDGLQCFRRNLSLAEIRELGRPGILTLDRDTGAPRYALLTALDRDSATLTAQGVQQKVTITALVGRWQGDFATLWKVPPGYGFGKSASAGVETRAWMSAQLPPGATLPAQLRAFQLSHGLAADGRPGPMTFMQLNRAAGVDEPRLNTLRNAS